MAKHQYTKRKLAYISWRNMRHRCYREGDISFFRYGARGITVCERWRHSFENFLADMGERSEGQSLDRIDVTKGYSPENCRWATVFEQARNKNSNHFITVGMLTLTIVEWSKRLGCLPCTISKRIHRYGWSEQKAVTYPVRSWKRQSNL